VGIYLRSVVDSKGDVTEDYWYCGVWCYNASLDRIRPGLFGVEKGGRCPNGAESDSPDYCENCDKPIGNPLTDTGKDYVREFVQSKESQDVPNVLADSLKKEYGYLFS